MFEKKKKMIPGICIFPLMTYRGELERNQVRNGGWKRKSFPFVRGHGTNIARICGLVLIYYLLLKTLVFMAL